MSDRVTALNRLFAVRKEMSAEETAQPDPHPTHTVPVPDPTQPAPKANRTRTVVAPNRPRFKAAPERDFNKRANSLEREALPAGTFPGSSKKIYDALYLRTRGAIIPARTIQARRRELLAWAGLRDIKTVDIHLKKLQDAGLVTRIKLTGEHEGSIYEVFLPEEVDPHRTRTVDEPDPNRETEIHRTQETVRVGLGQSVDFQRTSGTPKTSLKTNTERTADDEAAPHPSTREIAAFTELLERFARASTEITGKSPSVVDKGKWGDLAELLITELKLAAGRTESVSSVPAFLTEHLRRRLWKKDKRQIEAESTPSEIARPSVDASKCPDCFGTGMYYPEGFDKGVARCRHEKLASKSE